MSRYKLLLLLDDPNGYGVVQSWTLSTTGDGDFTVPLSGFQVADFVREINDEFPKENAKSA